MNSSTGKGNGAGVDKRTGLCSPARPSQDDQAPKASVAAPSGLAEGVAVPAQLKTEVFETETQTHETSAGCEGVDTLAPYHMAKWLEDFKVPLQPGATPPRPTLHRIDDPGTLSELDLDMKRTCQRSGDLPKVRWATPDDLEGIVNVYCASMRHHKVFYEVVFQGTLRRNIYNMIAGSGEKFIVAEVPGLLVGALSYRVYDEHGRVEGEGGKSDQRPVVLRPRMGALWGEWNDAQKVVWEAYANSSKGKRHMFIGDVLVPHSIYRDGISNKLLNQAFLKADVMKLPMFTVCYKETYGMPEFGLGAAFIKLASCEIDMEKWTARVQEASTRRDIREDWIEAYEDMVEEKRCLVRWAGMPLVSRVARNEL